MSHSQKTPVGRTMAGVLLLAILSGLVPWQGARAMICRMDRPVTAAPLRCGSCGVGDDGATAPFLVAGSCCRFAAPEEVATLPVFTQATHRAPTGDERVATAIPVEVRSMVATAAAVSISASASKARSEASPALSTHLRL